MRRPHPFIFFFLILPYGASFGFVAVTLEYVAVQHGIPVALFAGTVVATVFLPHSIKFLWAPMVDLTLSKKRWYAIALALTVAGTVLAASIPISKGTLGELTVVVIVGQVGLTFMGMCCESLMGLAVPHEKKGRASGWYQGGVYFGGGLGGGVGLWLAERLPNMTTVGEILGGAMLLCGLALFTFDEPPRMGTGQPSPAGNLLDRALVPLKGLWKDLWSIIRSADGLTGLLICLLPISAGAVSNAFSGFGPEWHASAVTVELVTGILGGVASGVGAVVGGFVADVVPRRLAYGISGALIALTAFAMAFLPHVALAYIALTLLYSFFLGLAMASFSAFVLETIGHGAVATKYNIFASLANFAISYMAFIDGRAGLRWGSNGMLLTDGICTFAGIAVLSASILALRKFRRAPAVDEPALEVTAR